MIFNFENINNEVIKTILKGKHSHKIIVTGSYALYNIYEKENGDKHNLELKLKDFDFDLDEILKKDENIENKIELLYFYLKSNIFNEVESLESQFDNIENVILTFITKKLNKRKYNVGNYNIQVKLEIEDDNNNFYVFSFDTGFETKELEKLQKELIIDNEVFKVRTYTLEKMLADKYLAFCKRIEMLQENKNNIKNKTSNWRKMSKDLFDIKYINSKNINILKVKEYFNLMLDKDIKIDFNELIKLTNKIINENINIFKKRENIQDNRIILEKYLNQIEINKEMKM